MCVRSEDHGTHLARKQAHGDQLLHLRAATASGRRWTFSRTKSLNLLTPASVRVEREAVIRNTLWTLTSARALL